MCDSIVVDRKLSGKGCTVFGKASDRRVNEPQPFVYVPAAAEFSRLSHKKPRGCTPRGFRYEKTYSRISGALRTPAFLN